MPLETGQGAFSAALFNLEAGPPAGVVDPQGGPGPKRFGVYRNNVMVSLIEAMLATFPAVAALVGEEFFRAMAREFVWAHPPRSRVLAEYGGEFSKFIEGFEPARAIPFLGDVARLERAWLDAYHCADAAALDPSGLAELAQEDLGGLGFAAHPATRLVPSRFAVADLWRAGLDNRPLEGIDVTQAQSALIVRPQFEVSVHSLSGAAGVFAAELIAGAQLGDAAEAALALDRGFDLGQALGRLLSAGAFTGTSEHGEHRA